MDVVAQFRHAMVDRQILPPEEIIADGRIHRCDAVGRPGRHDASYLLHLDGYVPAGGFQNHRDGLGWQDWRANARRKLSLAERERLNLLQQNRREKSAQRRADAVTKALAAWRAASEAKADHPYLDRKQVMPTGTFRELPVGDVAAIIGYTPRCGTEMLVGRLLIVPVKIGESLSTLEFIDENGRKSALTDGAKAGGYWAAKKLPEGNGAGIHLLIGEGVATVLSAQAATGYLGIAALCRGNLDAVARQMRGKYPAATIVMLADLGNGQRDAEAAARNAGAFLAVPQFGDPRPDDAKDFNDMATICGLDAVAKVIASAAAPPQNLDAATSFKLSEPLPLVAEGRMAPYPVDALPGSLGDAVREVAGFVQCPVALAGSSALSVLSVAGQGLVDVKRGPDLIGPASLYLLSVAESGERKSECDRRFAGVLRNHEAEQAERIKPDQARSRAARDAWLVEREALLSKIKRARKDGDPTDELVVELQQWETRRPAPVRSLRLVLESETAESLAYNLARPDGWPSGGILSSEAGIIFGGHSMRADTRMQNLALLNKLWSGESHRVGRRTSEQFICAGARLTMGLGVQPDVIQAFFDGGLARGSGFAARFLMAFPESTQGMRMYRDAPPNWPGLGAYERQLRDLLGHPLRFNERHELKTFPLDMDAAAFNWWLTFHNDVEPELKSDGEFAEVRDVASKAAENVARLAALFHVLANGPQGHIGAESVIPAGRLVMWYLFEARRCLNQIVVPKAILDADKLERWLVAKARREGVDRVLRRDALQYGPTSTRRAAELNRALDELTGRQRVEVRDDGRTIRVAPALLVGLDHGSRFEVEHGAP